MDDRDLMDAERRLAATYGLPAVMVRRTFELADQIRGKCPGPPDRPVFPDMPPEVAALMARFRVDLGLSEYEMCYVAARLMTETGELPAAIWPHGEPTVE